MFIGTHVLLYSREPDAARAFLRTLLGSQFIDSGGGWLIFAAPPAEMAVHPADEETETALASGFELYLMCDDIRITVADLRARGIEVLRDITDEGYGLFTALRVPGGGEIGLYEPRHPTALHFSSKPASGKRKSASRRPAKRKPRAKSTTRQKRRKPLKRQR